MKQFTCCMPILLAALLVSGCASAPKHVEPNEDTAFYLARFNEVWDASLAVLREESIVIDSMNKDRGVIVTKFVNYSKGTQAHHDIDSIAQRPSEARLAIWSQVGYTLNILVTPISEMSTKVKVIAHIEAYDSNVSQGWHECVSNKALENRIIEKVKAQL